MSATTSLADTHQSSNYQQGRLLLLIAGRRLWSPSGQTSVRPQRRRTLRFLRKAFWTHHAAPARSPLVARPWADTVPSLCSGLLPQNLWRYRLLNNIGVHSKLLANLRLVNFCHFQTLVIDQLQASVFRMLQTITTLWNILYNWCQNISVGLQKWLRFFFRKMFCCI